MTLQWLARIALALWFVYGIAAYAEGQRSDSSVPLQCLNAIASAAMIAALVWAGFR